MFFGNAIRQKRQIRTKAAVNPRIALRKRLLASGGGEQRSLYPRWNLDRDESIGREQVILPALVDDPKIAIAFRLNVP